MIQFSFIVFWISLFVIFFANIGYPYTIILIDKFLKTRTSKNLEFKPSVTIMVVAHNEEQVILEKLNNLKQINYPKSKMKIIVASDNSSDATNFIVENFIKDTPEMSISLYKAQKRAGKTNAQNEAQKRVETEFLVMTDANSMLDPDAISELMSSFTDSNISYVTGKLVYINSDTSSTSENESFYWNLDLKVREIESNIQTITAGNGALYAIRNDRYFDFNPIESHDSSMPLYYALRNEKAIANHDALVFEKAGETVTDEYQRKVRMNRLILNHILPTLKILNVFKYKWFTFFYLGHRTSRYLLWFAHLVLLISNVMLSIDNNFFKVLLVFHLIFWGVALVQTKIKLNNKIFNLIYYYAVTIAAQWHGIYRILTGKAKPFWEKAETTR